MRKGMVIVGLVLLLLGVVLWYVPVGNPQPSTAVASGEVLVVGASPPLAVLSPSLPYSAAWTSSGGSDTVTVYDCGTDSSCANAGSASSQVTSGSGTSGTLTWSGSRGDYFAIEPGNGTVTVTPTIGEPFAGGLIGLLLVIVGLVLLLVGAVRPPKPPAPAEEAPVAPAPEGEGTGEDADPGSPPAST